MTVAVGFRTGPTTDGANTVSKYVLTQVAPGLRYCGGAETGTDLVQVSLWSEEGRLPKTKLADMTGPSTIACVWADRSNTPWFNPPDNAYDLQPNTEYFIVAHLRATTGKWKYFNRSSGGINNFNSRFGGKYRKGFSLYRNALRKATDENGDRTFYCNDVKNRKWLEWCDTSQKWIIISGNVVHSTGASTRWMPSVSEAEIISSAGKDNTYHLGEKIEVALYYDGVIQVDLENGTPSITIGMGPDGSGTQSVPYVRGSGSRRLVFAHTVSESDASPEGIVVRPNSLALNGATISSEHGSALQSDELGHPGVRRNPAHKIHAVTKPAEVEVVYSEVKVKSTRVKGSKAVIRFDGQLSSLPKDINHVLFIKGTAPDQYPTEVLLQEVPRTGDHRLILKLGSAARAGQKVSVTYNGVTGTSLTDKSGLPIADFTQKMKNKTPGPAVELPAISISDASAQEGPNAALDFTVSLNKPAPERVVVNYKTENGTAEYGEDYVRVEGDVRLDLVESKVLEFAVGEQEKTITVQVIDDAHDEGDETFKVKLWGASNATIADDTGIGTISNDDPLQKMWLSRFGRTVAGHVTDAVSDRLAAPLTGAQVTVGGQSVDLAQTEDGAVLTQALTAVAGVLGAPSGPPPANEEGFGAGGWTGTDLRDAPTLGASTAREISGRELLLGSAFHVGRESGGAGPGLAAWGRVTVGGFDGETPADDASLRIDGEVTTGILGADAEWGRLLAGVAVSVSDGEGTFEQPGVDSGNIESTMTTVSPYARVSLTDRVSAWGLVGFGTGDMEVVQAANDRGGQTERVMRTDLGMRLGAVGGRGALLEGRETGGMDLALKADAFLVETEAEPVSNEGKTTADASRVRLLLEGRRSFETGGGGVLTPELELGLRHDGGDAETGTGVELGGRLSFAAAGSGLSMEASVRALVAHEASGYEEWGASGSVRLAPDERGRGLSFSLAPTWGAPASGVDRLWSTRDARGLAPDAAFEPDTRLEAELGYGHRVGGAFTGTPYAGLGLSGSGRDYRIGWRLTSAVRGDSGFEVNLDATRREAANDDAAPEHGVMLRGALRW